MRHLDQKKLFFIIAPDRSGTSLMQEIMNTFSNFCNSTESRIAGPDSPSCWEYVKKYNDFSYLEKFITKNWTSEFFIEKSPPSINCMPQISKRYPDANFILLKRNPLKIVLSQLNLFYGVSELGTRHHDLSGLVLKKGGVIEQRERIMTKRLLKMISNQVRYKEYLHHRVELRYEDIIDSLDSQLNLLQDYFGIKANFSKAQDQLEKPSYSSTFRYGLKDISDKISSDFIQLACNLWGYKKNDKL